MERGHSRQDEWLQGHYWWDRREERVWTGKRGGAASPLPRCYSGIQAETHQPLQPSPLVLSIPRYLLPLHPHLESPSQTSIPCPIYAVTISCWSASKHIFHQPTHDSPAPKKTTKQTLPLFLAASDRSPHHYPTTHQIPPCPRHARLNAPPPPPPTNQPGTSPKSASKQQSVRLPALFQSPNTG